MTAVTCVLYHHVGEETQVEADLNVTSSRTAFTAQIDYLQRNYDIIDLETLLGGILPRRPLLITFDDCYASVLDVARDVLAPKGLPSVFFINPGLLGTDAISLDRVLAWRARYVGLTQLCDEIGVAAADSLSALIGSKISRLSAKDRSALKERLIRKIDPHDFASRSASLSEHDLELLPPLGVEIGNHTATHVHCRAITPDEHAEEIVAAKKRLETLSGVRVRSFAVPYGHHRDLTPEVLRTLRESGHEAIFLVHARSNKFRPAADIWYRVSLHSDSPRKLLLKLAVLPLIRSFKHMVVG